MDRGGEASRRTTRGGWPRGWLVAVGCAVALAAVTKVTSFDTWVHLSLGRWISETGRVPFHNLLSHTQGGRATVDHQWLFQLGLYRLWELVGVGGLVVIKAVVVGVAFGVVAATARRKGARLWATVSVVLLAGYAARFRFSLRPQVVSFLLLATYLYVLWVWRLGASRWLLVSLLPLQLLWANLHGAAVMGCGVTLAFAAGESVRALAGARLGDVVPRPRGWAELGALWAVGAALVAVSLVNPNGLRVLAEPFALAEVQRAARLKAFLADRAALPLSELAGRHAFFGVLAVLSLASAVAALVRRDVTEAGLAAGLLVAALHSQRFVGLFAVGAAPVVARNASDVARLLGAASAGRSRWRGWRAVMTGVVLLGVLEVAWRGLWGQQPTGLG
ncbi:MAG: hypothetical protein ACODAJ_13195, partial [Planctomycetota bacterium]